MYHFLMSDPEKHYGEGVKSVQIVIAVYAVLTEVESSNC